MTDTELIQEIASIREWGNDEYTLLQKLARDLTAAIQEKVEKAITDSGKIICPQCNGFGKVQRLDSGIMQKFGLRDWDGCKKCGGDGSAVSGRGFITPHDEPVSVRPER